MKLKAIAPLLIKSGTEHRSKKSGELSVIIFFSSIVETLPLGLVLGTEQFSAFLVMKARNPSWLTKLDEDNFGSKDIALDSDSVFQNPCYYINAGVRLGLPLCSNFDCA